MEPFVALGVSLGLGLLIGFQRERTETRFGGIRTFPLISLLGTFCGWLGLRYGVWIVAAGLLAVLGVTVVSNLSALRREEPEHGQTTEIAALLTFAIGAYLPEGKLAVALVGAGVLVILLHLKDPMHHLVEKLGRRDISAIMQLVVVSLIILPLLPNRTYGPYGVLNPFHIWIMVVLIVAISLGGYVAFKTLGEKSGAFLSGVLGGLISSTATTFLFARRLRSTPDAISLGLVVIPVASAVSYVRVLVEIAVVTPGKAGQLILPIVAMLVWTVLLSLGIYFAHRGETEKPPEPTNPAELQSALIFGLIYAAVLFAVAAVKQNYGTSALYTVASVSGLVNTDAITLSIARMVEAARIETEQGWRLILIATVANLAFKWAVVGLLGRWKLAGRLALFFGLAIAGGVAIALFWPAAWSFAK